MADGPVPPPLDPALVRSLRPRRPWRGMITVAVLLAVGIGWMTFIGRRDRARGSKDAHGAAQAMADRMAAIPEFRTWVLTHDVTRDGPLVAQRGLHRLDDATLKRRVELMAKILAAGDVHRCAAMERGRASLDDLAAMLDKVTPADRDEFNEIVFRAAEADIKGTRPPRWLSLKRRTAFRGELRARLAKRPDGAKLLAALGHYAAANDADTCALARATDDTVSAMPDPLRADGALLLIGGGGGHALFEDRRWLSLDDDALVARAEILEALLAQADEAGCAALARQAAPAGEVDALLQHTPARFRDSWYELSQQLDAARETRKRFVTDLEMNLYSSELRRRLARDRFDWDAFNNPDDATPAAACRAHRLLVSALLRLPKLLRAIGARDLVGGAPPVADD